MIMDLGQGVISIWTLLGLFIGIVGQERDMELGFVVPVIENSSYGISDVSRKEPFLMEYSDENEVESGQYKRSGGVAPRIDIPNPPKGREDNPGVEFEESRKMLEQIMQNPEMKRKVEQALSDGLDEVKQGWEDSPCLVPNDGHFPTIQLRVRSNVIDDNNEAEQEVTALTTKFRVNKVYAVKRDRFFIRNNGNGMLSIKLEKEVSSEATIRGKGWDNEYVLAKGDFYWSLDNNYGSQHSIDGQSMAAELQLIHYAKHYDGIKAAARADRGLIITSILLEAAGHGNPFVDALANAAVSVLFPGKSYKEVHGPLDIKMLFPKDMSFYKYHGPYVGEPCSRNVTWYVFRHPIPISYAQLNKFREVRNERGDRLKGVFETSKDYPDSMETLRKIEESRSPKTPNDIGVFLVVTPTMALSKAGLDNFSFVKWTMVVLAFALCRVAPRNLAIFFIIGP